MTGAGNVPETTTYNMHRMTTPRNLGTVMAAWHLYSICASSISLQFSALMAFLIRCSMVIWKREDTYSHILKIITADFIHSRTLCDPTKLL